MSSEKSTDTYFTRPTILKLARKAGVKSLSEDSYKVIDAVMCARIEQLVREGLWVLRFRGARVLNASDIQEGIKLRGMFYADGKDLRSTRVHSTDMK